MTLSEVHVKCHVILIGHAGDRIAVEDRYGRWFACRGRCLVAVLVRRKVAIH